MHLTEVKPYKGNVYQLAFAHTTELFFVHVSVVHRFALAADTHLTEERWAEVQHAELARKAYSRACYLLDVRSYSYQDMFRKLEKNYPEDVCYTVLDQLTASGQINDRAYAEQAAHYYVEVKYYGLWRARQEMHRKGLLWEQIDEALAPYAERTGEFLMELVQGKCARYFIDPTDRTAIEKGKAVLARMGYRYADIQQAVSAYISDSMADDEDD